MKNKQDLLKEVIELNKERTEQGNGVSNLNQGTASKIIDLVIDSIFNVASDGGLQIVGKFTLETITRAARTGRNPRTKEEIQIPACNTLKFKIGKSWKDALNDK